MSNCASVTFTYVILYLYALRLPAINLIYANSDDWESDPQSLYWQQYVWFIFNYLLIQLLIESSVCKVIENRGQEPRIALKLKPILVSAGFEDVVLDKRRVQFSKLQHLQMKAQRRLSYTDICWKLDDGNLGKEFLFDFKSGITGGKVVFAPGMGLDDAMYMNKVNQVGEECTRVNGHLDWYQYVARKPC